MPSAPLSINFDKADGAAGRTKGPSAEPTVQETDGKQLQQHSRLERSAGLHCIVLAIRLVRIDNFAAEASLPILIAGALSGVVQYLPGGQHVEAIEDGAQSLLEALERQLSPPRTPMGEAEREEHTTKSTTSSMTASSTYPAAVDDSLNDDGRKRCALRFASGDDGFDDPATCGTFALRRLCLCGLGFALLPPASGAGATSAAGIRPRHKPSTATGRNPNLAIVPAIVDALVVLAHGDFLHPDASALAGFLNHGEQDASKPSLRSSRDQHQHGHGESPPPALPVAAAADAESSTESASLSSSGASANGGGAGGEIRDCESAGVKGGGGGAPGGAGGAEVMAIPSASRGTKGPCMSVARLLLAQISVSDLQKAQARSFGHAKRRARIAAAIEENKLPPAAKRSVGLNCRMKATGGGNNTHGGGGGGGGTATLPRDDGAASDVLNVSPRPCGGCVAARDYNDEQHRAVGEAGIARVAGTGALQVAPVAGTDERYLAKNSSFADQPKSAGGSGAGSGGAGRGRRSGGVGAAAVSEALGDRAVEIVAEQLGITIKGRRFEHDASVERLAEAHARVKEAKELKLDRNIDFRRRLAAAASEAHQEIETAALRRQILRGGGGGHPSSRKSRGGGGGGGGNTAAPPPVTTGATTAAARATEGNVLDDDRKWDENGDFIEPDAAAVAAAAAASAAAVTAESLARWNRQQTHEQQQHLRQLIVEMKEAVGGEGDVGGRRPTLRRGSSSVDSRTSNGRVSISGSGIFRELAQGVDATHSAILSSMRDDGVDARAYLDERRRAFRDVVATGRRSSTAGGTTTDWETTEENAMDALLGGAGRQSSSRNSAASAGGVSSANTSTTGGGGGGRDDESAGTTDEGASASGVRQRAVARDAEQLRLERARRAAREERIEIERREAIEAERSARRRAKDKAEAARAERKAKALAQKEMQRRQEALDRQEEEARIERERGQEERVTAAAAEKKRQAKLRRARERENRKKVAWEQARHQEEMAKIERWRQQEQEHRQEVAKREEEVRRAAEAKRALELEALTREEERRRAEVEAKRLALKEEREVAAARLKGGEFRYIRGRLVFREAKGGLLMAGTDRG
eukprot:g11857.t1